ncbi:fasciclin domain-containing protein [Kineosporia babensis]|uniref:Fasciclin domain-containing protein n=1 Tax=Kineosporia babensis TaxID=499548 RepID=A0A9X1SV14_9ACTN|nr:fasciclin domain-containing protein [Kineosporia babensis]MCD5312310.1 fasciclin domain-containing protein [Kineosporia babensis]
MITSIRRLLAVGAAVTMTLTLASCSGDDASEAEPSTSPSLAAPISAEKAALVGPGCAAYAAQVPTGKGSVEEMAKDPVTTAAQNNPMLKKLTEALSGGLNPQVNLVSTLEGKGYTVFAPVDTAFAQVPGKRLNKLKKDAKALTATLNYHVVTGELAPAKVLGRRDSVAGPKLDITGKGNEIKVNNAHVICGGIKTANATVYLIDKVLDPADA